MVKCKYHEMIQTVQLSNHRCQFCQARCAQSHDGNANDNRDRSDNDNNVDDDYHDFADDNDE